MNDYKRCPFGRADAVAQSAIMFGAVARQAGLDRQRAHPPRHPQHDMLVAMCGEGCNRASRG